MAGGAKLSHDREYRRGRAERPELRLGDTLGKVAKHPLNTVRYCADPLLQPVDLRGNFGWSELTAA